MGLDLEAAEAAWPNFVVFYERFKEHPSFGQGSVKDSVASSSSVLEVEIDLEPSSPGNTTTPASEITVCDISTSEEEEGDGDGVEILQPPQSKQKQSVKKGGSTGEEMGEEEIMAPPLKKKKGTEILTARKAKKRKSILYKQAVSGNIY